MEVTVTETTITVVAAWGGWTDAEWDATMRRHGVYDYPIIDMDYTTDGEVERWLMYRDVAITAEEVADEFAC